MKTRKRHWLILLGYLGLSLLALMMLAVFLLSATGPGLRLTAALISNIASSDKQQIRVEGISNVWTGTTRIERITLTDPSGPVVAISNLGANWNRASLAGLRFSAENLDIERIDLFRLPSGGDENEGSAGLPVELDISSFTINALNLSEELIRAPAAMKISGSLRAYAAPLDIAALILAERTDRQGDTLSLDLAYQPERNRLEFDFGYLENSDGLLGNLLELPNRPEIALSAKAAGSLENLRFTSLARADNTEILDISGTIEKQDGETRFLAKGDGQPETLVPENLRQLLAGDFLLDLDAVLGESGAITFNKAKIDTDSFYGVITGRYDPAGDNRITGGITAKGTSVELTDAAVPGIANLAFRSFAFDVSGPAERTVIETSVDLPLIDLGDTRIEGLRVFAQSEDFNVESRSGSYELNSSIQSVKSGNESAARLLKGEHYITANGAITPHNISWREMAARNDGVQVTASGSYDLTEAMLASNLFANIARDALPSALQRIADGRSKISADISVGRGGKVKLANLAANTGSMAVEGAVTLDAEQIDGKIDLSLSDVSGLAKDAQGRIDGELQISGPIETPDLIVNLGSDLIKIAEHAISDLRLDVRGIASAANPDLAIRLDGAIDGQPLNGGASIAMRDGIRIADAIRLQNGENTISGKIELDDANIPSGEIMFDFPQIGSLAALALQEMSGNVSGNLVLGKNGTLPVATLTIDSPRIVREDVSVSDISARLTIDNYLKAPAVSGTATVSELKSGDTLVSSTRLAMTTDNVWTNFDVRTQINRDIPVTATGRVRVADGRTIVELKNAETGFQGIATSLASPATVVIENGTTTISTATLAIGGGSATVSGSVSDRLALEISLSKVSAALANRFAEDLGANGPISGPVSVRGAASNPEVNFDLNWENAGTAQLSGAGIGALTIKAKGAFANRQLQINTGLSGPAGLSFSGGGNIALADTPTLDLAFNGQLPFSILASTLAENGLSLTGNANADIQISGTSLQPRLNGSVRSSDARFVHAESGIAVEKIALAIDLSGDRAVIRQMNGQLSTGGKISVNGNIDIDTRSGLPADIRIRIDDGVYADGKSVDTKFNAALRLDGGLLSTPMISGRVDLEKTAITVPDRIPESISRLNVRHKNASAALEKQADSLKPKEASAAGGINLNLAINAPNQIFIRGRGIDAEMGGNLQLNGNLGTPVAIGGFDLRRGRLSILGKRLDFTSGRITFAGSLVPELNLKADSVSEEYTLSVIVSGPADSPEFKFSSVPALAEDEVLARLIFNRNIGDLSPLQIVQLAQAVASLTGNGGNSSLLQKFQKLIAVDDLDVKTDAETGETTVGAGRYINDKTYVGVERGASPGTGKATIDLNIGRGVKLRGEATETGKNKAGIFFEREY